MSQHSAVTHCDQLHYNSLCSPHTSLTLLRVGFLRDFGAEDGDGFNPAAVRNDAVQSPARDFLSVRLAACLSLPAAAAVAAAALSRLPPTVASVSLLPERPAALVPLALQWRLNGPGAL